MSRSFRIYGPPPPVLAESRTRFTHTYRRGRLYEILNNVKSAKVELPEEVSDDFQQLIDDYERTRTNAASEGNAANAVAHFLSFLVRYGMLPQYASSTIAFSFVQALTDPSLEIFDKLAGSGLHPTRADYFYNLVDKVLDLTSELIGEAGYKEDEMLGSTEVSEWLAQHGYSPINLTAKNFM